MATELGGSDGNAFPAGFYGYCVAASATNYALKGIGMLLSQP